MLELLGCSGIGGLFPLPPSPSLPSDRPLLSLSPFLQRRASSFLFGFSFFLFFFLNLKGPKSRSGMGAGSTRDSPIFQTMDPAHAIWIIGFNCPFSLDMVRIILEACSTLRWGLPSADQKVDFVCVSIFAC